MAAPASLMCSTLKAGWESPSVGTHGVGAGTCGPACPHCPHQRPVLTAKAEGVGEGDGGEGGGSLAMHVEEGAAHHPRWLHQPGVLAPGQQGVADGDGLGHLKNQARDAALVCAVRVQLQPAGTDPELAWCLLQSRC